MSDNKNNKTGEELLREITQVLGKQVPIEVKNYEAYYEYLQLINHPIHSIKLHVGNKKVPVTNPYPNINKEIRIALEEDIITEDQAAKLKEVKRQQHNKKLRAMAKLKQAYGTCVNKNGEKIEVRSVFDPVKEKMTMLFGRMFTAQEVHEVCLKQWQLKVTLNAVNDFRNKNIDEINKLIEEHKRTYSDIRLGYKRSRLEELVWMYNKRKRIYETANKAEDHRLLLQTLEQIKREVEGDVLRIDGGITIGLEDTVNEHIKKELVKTLPIRELVIARVASRTGLPITKMVKYINDSIYRKYLDKSDVEDVEFKEVYPSTQTYDFDRIKRINEQKEQQDQLEAKREKEQQQPIDTNKVNTIKEILKNKLLKAQGDLNKDKNSLSKNF